jgi:hypothetical protein
MAKRDWVKHLPASVQRAAKPLRAEMPKDVEPGPGEIPAAPNFVGVGAQKAGTSWWFALLLAHPQTYQTAARNKELHFFDRLVDDEIDREIVERYHRLFARPEGTIAGEFTPTYSTFFWIPAQLAQAAPEAKVIMMFRDPIERYRSSVAQGIRNDPMNDVRRIAMMGLNMSAYATQIRAMQRVFPAEQMQILQYEKCVADPAHWYGETLRFLEYEDTSFIPDSLTQPVRKTKGEKPPLTPWLAARLHDELDEQVDWIRANVPQIDVELWPNFRNR